MAARLPDRFTQKNAPTSNRNRDGKCGKSESALICPNSKFRTQKEIVENGTRIPRHPWNKLDANQHSSQRISRNECTSSRIERQTSIFRCRATASANATSYSCTRSVTTPSTISYRLSYVQRIVQAGLKRPVCVRKNFVNYGAVRNVLTYQRPA